MWLHEFNNNNKSEVTQFSNYLHPGIQEGDRLKLINDADHVNLLHIVFNFELLTNDKLNNRVIIHWLGKREDMLHCTQVGF